MTARRRGSPRDGEPAGKLSRVCIVLLAVILTGLTLGLVLGHGPWAGPDLVPVSYNHGLNYGDVPVLAAWLVGVSCCWHMWRRT